MARAQIEAAAAAEAAAEAERIRQKDADEKKAAEAEKKKVAGEGWRQDQSAKHRVSPTKQIPKYSVREEQTVGLQNEQTPSGDQPSGDDQAQARAQS